MENKSKIVWSILGIIILVGLIIYYTRNAGENSEEAQNSLTGCYVSTLARDVYTLKIDSVEGSQVTGALSYDNFEKDSSVGTFSGTIDGDILRGIYTFNSEGMHSEREVIFKKSGDSFVQGFGPVAVVNGRESFTDINQVEYEGNSVFSKTNDCPDLDADVVRTVVLMFGSALKSVSLQSPTAGSDMDSRYGPYVAPDLLAQWKNNPSTAPGRLTSSPWPERITIDDVRSQGDGTYIVEARIVEEDNTTVATDEVISERYIILELGRINGRWMITSLTDSPFVK